MNVGDLILLKSFVNHPAEHASFTYKAPPKMRFVAVLLGVEPADGSAPLDAKEALLSFGWTPAQQDEEQTEENGEEDHGD